jgi:CheY-like chemotaxis protein
VSSVRPSFDRPREIEGLRVLVVDDEPDARDLLKTLLESCNVKVTTASNAADAFDVVKSREVDIVLSDIAMPAEDGLSFIRRVRELSREEGGRVPAVALTAYARLEDRTKALRAGFNSHVAKPVEAAELLAVLSSLATR